MQYHIDQTTFDSTFIVGKERKFQHKQNCRFNMFPFTGSTSDKIVDSFDNIIGAFLRNLYSLESPESINREEIINNICTEVSCNTEDSNVLKKILRDMYFVDDCTLKSSGITTYKYAKSSKNDQKISAYIVSVLCEVDQLKSVLDKNSESKNVLDSLVVEFLPELKQQKEKSFYIPMLPNIKECFTADLSFLFQDQNADFSDIIQLISYYYFFYTSQVLLYINKFGNEEPQIEPIYFCTEWERASKNRECYIRGWRQIENKLDTMFSHAVLLEMLNQTSSTTMERYDYCGLLSEYMRASEEDRKRIFFEIEDMKNKYVTIYAKPEGFEYEKEEYIQGDLYGLIKYFFDAIMKQFKSTSRNRANDAYKSSFYAFCRNNYLQNRKASGLMLVLSEETLILITKVVLNKNRQMRLNTLFDEFKKRGIYMDNQTKESVVSFYEKLNIIEKKSDSGDAQYVKGIL